MRLIVLGVCLFAAACSGQALNSPTSPTNASLGPAQTAAQVARRCRSAVRSLASSMFRRLLPTGLPRARRPTSVGSPRTLTAEVSPENTSTGTFHFTAANGDQLSGTFVGIEGVFIPPNTAGLRKLRRSRTEPVGLRGPLERLR